MDSNQQLRRIFIFILFGCVCLLMIFYVVERQELAQPYVTKIRHAIGNQGNFLSLLSDNVTDSTASTLADALNVETTEEISSAEDVREEFWTYACDNGSCKRKFYSNKDIPRRTFLSCVHLCSSYAKIWPKVMTESVQKDTKKFKLATVQFSINSKFEAVEELLNKAVKIFVHDLNQIKKSVRGRENGEFNGSLRVAINVESDETSLSMDIDECYSLSLSVDDDVKISAKTFFGARHALVSLQQMIWFDDAEEAFMVLASASIKDCPKFIYRGLMLDTSRHYFSIASIKRTLIGMSHVKLNRFHWHMTDSQSFPFVSENYPELSQYGAYSSSEIYTHDDIRELVEFARVRGIQIIPEIDAPAHAGNGWQFGPEKGLGDLSLCINQQPWQKYCGEPSCGQLNPTNNNTYDVLQKLYEELLNLTGNRDYFHIGGDEVNFDCWRQFIKGDLGKVWCNFMIEALNRLKMANKNQSIKHVALWNSDWNKIKCLPPENFTIQVWLANQQQVKQLLDANYNIIVSHVDAWYLDCGFGSWRSTSGAGTCPPFKAWYTVYNYSPWRNMMLNKQQMAQIKGGEACLWTEQVDEHSLDSRVWPRAMALAERLWSDPEANVINNKETINRFSIFRTRFLHLGLKSEAIFPKYCEQNENECM